jgi:hypothetical protein
MMLYVFFHHALSILPVVTVSKWVAYGEESWGMGVMNASSRWLAMLLIPLILRDVTEIT